MLYSPSFLQVQKGQVISLAQLQPSLTSLIPFVHRSKGFEPGMLQNLREAGSWEVKKWK